MAEEQVKVLGAWGSPFSHRVELALKLKGVEYDYIEEDLSNKSPLLLKYNPVHKKVPVLIHNGKPIAESLIILEYIDETWKENPILPQDPYERAIARFWAKFIDEKCLGTLWSACWTYGKEREKIVGEARKLLETLEHELKEKNFFGGDDIGFVDISANLIAFWAGVLEEVAGVSLIKEKKFTVLDKWIEGFISSTVVKETLPPRDELLGFFRARYEAQAAPKSMACNGFEELLLFYVFFILISMFFSFHQ